VSRCRRASPSSIASRLQCRLRCPLHMSSSICGKQHVKDASRLFYVRVTVTSLGEGGVVVERRPVRPQVDCSAVFVAACTCQAACVGNESVSPSELCQKNLLDFPTYLNQLQLHTQSTHERPFYVITLGFTV
jgi:hypothetical protein